MTITNIMKCDSPYCGAVIPDGAAHVCIQGEVIVEGCDTSTAGIISLPHYCSIECLQDQLTAACKELGVDLDSPKPITKEEVT